MKIISTIYDVIGKFKFEDDKKLVGYVIIADILARQATTEKIVKVVEVQQKVETNSNISTSTENTSGISKIAKKIDLTISDVKNNWHSILAEATKKRVSYRVFLMEANPVSVEGNTILIRYDRKFLFAKEQMETTEYNNEFTEIIRTFFNEKNLQLKYEIIGEKKSEANIETDFYKKVEDYFRGNSN